MSNRAFKTLYYITHRNNLISILQYGILSHQQIGERKLDPTLVYNAEIVNRRREVRTPDGKSLWDYANLYFQARNPMLYKVLSESDKNDVVILGVKPQVLHTEGAFISLGNAAHSSSSIVDVENGLKVLTREYWKILNSDWWKTEDGPNVKLWQNALSRIVYRLAKFIPFM